MIRTSITSPKVKAMRLLAVTAAACAVVGAHAATARFSGGFYDGYDRNDAQSGMGILTVDNASGATNVLSTSAALNGTLWDTAGDLTMVFVYGGPTDGATNTLSWSNRCDFGVCTSVQALTTNVTGLAPSTTCYYRFCASNQAGQVVWAPASTNFPTFGPLTVTASGAASIGPNTATLNGAFTAGASATILVYWGETPDAWTGCTNLGIRGLGAFSPVVAALRAGCAYSYRCCATNAYGTAWSDAVPFQTPAGTARYGGGGYDGYDAMVRIQTLKKPGTMILFR